jgi:hypothetical protein
MLLISCAYEWFQIKNEDIILSKSGVATVTIEQTIPLGCSYREDDTANCLETISFEEIGNKADDCSGRIEVKSSDDPSKPFIVIKVHSRVSVIFCLSTSSYIHLNSYETSILRLFNLRN